MEDRASRREKLMSTPRTGIALPACDTRPIRLFMAMRTRPCLASETDFKEVVEAYVIRGELLAEVVNGVLHNKNKVPHALLVVKGK